MIPGPGLRGAAPRRTDPAASEGVTDEQQEAKAMRGPTVAEQQAELVGVGRPRLSIVGSGPCATGRAGPNPGGVLGVGSGRPVGCVLVGRSEARDGTGGS
jgi:hypothetical protein